MNNTQHEAWRQILSVARNADLADGDRMADMYLSTGGFRHVVSSIEPLWLPVEEPSPEEAVLQESASSAEPEPASAGPGETSAGTAGGDPGDAPATAT